MRFFRTKSALVVGAIGLAIAVGAIGIFASQRTGPAFAQGGETELEGLIEALPATGVLGNWQVSGRTVIVTEQTEIDREGRTLAPGLRVEIEGIDQPDGSIVASEIEVDDDDDGPSASHDDDDSNSGPSPIQGDDDENGPAAPAGTQTNDDDDDGGNPSAGQGDDDDGGSPSASQGDDDD